MPISEVVSVTITIETARVSRQGFGVPLIAAYHTKWTDRVRTYNAASALTTMVGEGFATTDPAYLAMQAIVSQSPRPKTVKIGRRNTTWSQTVDLVPTVANTTIYSGTVNALPWTFTSDGSATLAEICTGIAAAITALANVTADGSSGTKVVITADAAAKLFNVSRPTGAGVYVFNDSTSATGVATDLATIRAADGDFYGLVLDMTSRDGIEAAAATAETWRVVFASNSADSDQLVALTTDDVASELKALSYRRAGHSYHKNYDSFLGAGWLGVMLPYEPGAATFAHKTVAGVSVSTELSATEVETLTAKHANFYTTVGGVNVMRWGTAAGGSYLDDTISIDWATARIEEEVWGLIAATPKLPFTDASGDRLGGTVMGVLLLGVQRNVFANDPVPTVTVPKVADISPIDRAGRVFGTIEFTARLAGAIHQVDIQGSVSI